jgi:hypothetical protein
MEKEVEFVSSQEVESKFKSKADLYNLFKYDRN